MFTLTRLVDRPATKDAVHVLIVSVGRYEPGGPAPLPGALLTARRLAQWWMTCNFPGSRRLGSLELLVSDIDSVYFDDENGTPVEIAPARYADVRQAIKSWAERSNDSSLAVLHWVGHGEWLSETGEGGSAGHVLYCEDREPGAGGTGQLGFDWGRTRRGLERATNAPVLCFLDACQLVPRDAEASYGSPWNLHRGPPRTRADIFLPGHQGDKTYCARPGESVGGDFVGGALFSEAILLALSRFGAVNIDDDTGCAVYPDGMKQAVRLRMKRWNAREKVPLGIGGIRHDSGQFSEDDPIVLAPAPYGMVAVVHPEPARSGYDCLVSLNGGEPATALSLVQQEWEGDLAHGKGYRALVRRKPLFGGAEEAEVEFDVDTPMRRVKVPWP